MSKHTYGSITLDNKNNSTGDLFHYGVVTSYKDESGAKRIKVRIQGIDDGKIAEDLPEAFPLIPKMYSITPKDGETVIIFIKNGDGNTRSDRFYIGPIVSQHQFLKHSDVLTATAGIPTSKVQFSINHNMIPDAKGVFEDTEDVVIEGRENSDIVFKKNEIKIRVGKYTDERKQGVPLFNFKNPTYIQMRHDISINGSKTKFSMINMVSDKIFLLTHEKGSPRFNLNTPIEQIPDDELIKILENAHPLPYGDKLMEFLMLMKRVILSHVHPYPGMKPTNLNGDNSINDLETFDTMSILSKNIKIN